MPAKLYIISDQLQTTQEVAFDKPRLTIGRKAGNDLHFNRAEISGTHAAFLSEGDQFFVQDLGSTNGTFMNGGQLVANQKYPLTPQDVVVIAPFRITLVLTSDMTKTFSEGSASQGRRESGTIIDVPGRVKTGTAEHELPVAEAPAPAPAPPEPKPQPAAAPAAAPPKPAPAPAPVAPPPKPKPEPKPAPSAPPRPAPPPAAVAPVEENEEEPDIVVPSGIGDYLWLAIGGLCFIGAIALVLYLLFGF